MRKLDQLEAIYRDVPRLQCKGLCASTCCGPVILHEPEHRRMIDAGGAQQHHGGGCGWLKDGRCTVYAVRPLVCRVYGTVPALRCPHGCEPERWLSAAEANRLLRRLRKLGGYVIDVLRRVR
jgi:Fe-S-cluster containining protein